MEITRIAPHKTFVQKMNTHLKISLLNKYRKRDEILHFITTIVYITKTNKALNTTYFGCRSLTQSARGGEHGYIGGAGGCGR